MNLLSGRVVLVTGAGRGIGAAIACAFAKEGAKVAVHGRDPVGLSAVRSSIERICSSSSRGQNHIGWVNKFSEEIFRPSGKEFRE